MHPASYYSLIFHQLYTLPFTRLLGILKAGPELIEKLLPIIGNVKTTLWSMFK